MVVFINRSKLEDEVVAVGWYGKALREGSVSVGLGSTV